jgi:serine/threonine-protein kinase
VTSIAGGVAGALADRYRIERQLGAGGMATVYLAADLKHDRKVAIKVLKPELAAVLGAERFVVEIKTTAALQHPHILPLFDSGTAEGFLYYVMPYVEGETIRERLNRETQFGIEEAVRIAREIADALDYAHRHGVIHRDIKPENLLLHDGRAMVMDFGIALAVSAAAGGRMTETGLSLGTPHYMSPEQATAEKEITGRSDIYSLASVLYEMLAGVPPHEGGSAQQTIMRIITDTPRPVTELRKSVPPHVAAAVMQALEKLPADRFASAAEFSAALDGRIAPRMLATNVQERRAEARWKRVAIGALVAALVFATAAARLLVWPAAATDDSQRVEFAYRANAATNDEPLVGISPDGRRIVQAVHDSNGVAHLALRDLGSAKLSIVSGTDGASRPAFSPDGESIAFVVGNTLRKVSVAGGPPIVIADSVGGMIPAWTPDGRTLVFTRNGRGLSRVSAAGGTATALTGLDTARKEFAHWAPQVLPGGKVAIFNAFSTPIAKSRIEAVDLETRRVTVVLEGAIFARYVASGHLLFARDGRIFAVPFDPGKARVLGTAVPVVDDLAWSLTDGYAAFDVSRNGTLVYLKASDWIRPHRVVWVDRSGNERTLMAEEGQWAEPRLSPDHRWLAVTRTDPGWQIWLYDLSRQVTSQLTRSEGVSFGAVWMPDSRSIIHSIETPVYDLRRLPIDGSTPQMLVATPFDKKAVSVSPDGRVVAYFEAMDRDRLMSAPTLPGSGEKPEVMGASENAQANASFSPDGKWLAYEQTPTSEAMQVYVRPLGRDGGRRQVSADGGSQPRWSKNGREIVYRKGDAMFAASFDPQSGEVGTPVLLFRKPDAGQLGAVESTYGYDVTPDGSQFVLVEPVARPNAQPTVVVLNWFAELKRKAPR